MRAGLAPTERDTPPPLMFIDDELCSHCSDEMINHLTLDGTFGLPVATQTSYQVQAVGNMAPRRVPTASPQGAQQSAAQLSRPQAESSDIAVRRQTKAKTIHTCESCGKIFPSTSKLMRHDSVHSHVKNFECSICLHKFTQKSSLKIHMKKHGK
jgi:uncharacterized Zn-finger protein